MLGHCSPVMPTGPLRACKSQAKSHILINLERAVFTGKSQASALPYWPRYHSVNTAGSRSDIFREDLTLG